MTIIVMSLLEGVGSFLCLFLPISAKNSTFVAKT